MLYEVITKSRLQEWCQKHGAPLPKYRLLSAEGPPHERTFLVAARLWDGREEKGKGKTKKEAEMEAADRILSLLSGDEGIPSED